MFCYDRINNTSLLLEDGLKDDFYNTGYITDLQPLDLSGDKYWYVGKIGTTKEFQTSTGVFLVELKG